MKKGQLGRLLGHQVACDRQEFGEGGDAVERDRASLGPSPQRQQPGDEHNRERHGILSSHHTFT